MTELPWAPPKSVTVEQVHDARQYVQAVSAQRPCVDGDYLAHLIATLMSGYFVNIDSERMKRLVAAEWIDCLKVFPRDAVRQAVTEWRNNHEGKPTWAHIRKLCIRFYGEVAWQQFERAQVIAGMTPNFTQSSQKPADEPWKPPTPEQKAAVAKMVQDCLKNIGGNVSRETILAANVAN